MPWSVQRVPQRNGVESWTVTDSSYDVVAPVDRFLAHLGAVDRSPGTVRSYATYGSGFEDLDRTHH
jgi:hypothetical protein